MTPSLHSQEMPSWYGFAVGLLGGFALSTGVVGLIAGYAMGGNMTGSLIGVGAVAQDVPAPPPALAPDAAPPAPSAPLAAVDAKTDHVRGNANAKVTIVEYSDFECPFCKRHHDTMKQLVAQYGDDVNWVYRHFPLSFHPSAQKAAEGSECAAELGGNEAFWTYADEVFALAQVTVDQLPGVAKKIGLDEAAFKTCLDSGKHAQKVTDQMNGGSSAGVQGTPGTFVVNNDTQANQNVSGAVPLSTFQAIIDPMLGK